MATLSSALNYALSGLSVAATQSSVASRNVSSAGDENYTKKTAELVNLPGRGPVISQISRSSDRLLLEKLLSSTSTATERQITLEALNRVSGLTGDPQDERSIAAMLSGLQDKLRSFEQNPASVPLARGALEAARKLADSINSASREITSIRSDADKAIAESADRITNLLSQFKVVNDSIVRGQGTAGDLSESLDQRDSILKLLSEEVGIRTAIRSNNDMMIFAEGGAVLFEGSPRSITFQASGFLPSGSSGNALLIDGVPIAGPNAVMSVSGGRIAAQAALRDSLAPLLSQQLDQIAAGLVYSFSESDPLIPAALPQVEGLFQGNGTIPLLTEQNAGLADELRINSLADPEQGGSPFLIRDGGFGGAGYIRNSAAQPGYQARIVELVNALDSRLNFGGWGDLAGPASLKELGAQSAAWVEQRRKDAQSSLDSALTIKSRSATSLAQVTGVNIDQEMAVLLDLERSYQASSKVLSVVNSMFGTLLEVVG